MILVTGASGFVGRHVTRALAESGVRVRAMVRTARGAAALDGVECEVPGDASGVSSLRSAKRFDALALRARYQASSYASSSGSGGGRYRSVDIAVLLSNA